MREATDEGGVGVDWLNGSKLNDIDFADNIALLAEEKNGLQQQASNLERAAEKFR